MGINLLASLEALRVAFRGLRRYNTPCAQVPTPFKVHIRDGLGYVLVADNTIPVYQGDRVHRPSPGRQDCPICRELPVHTFGDAAPEMVEIHTFGDPELIPIGSGDARIAVPPLPASWTAARALEEMRRVTTAEGTGGGAAAYAPAEGPTSVCFQCGRNVPPADLFVGKRSGIALCEPCLEKWEKAGRAKRTGEF